MSCDFLPLSCSLFLIIDAVIESLLYYAMVGLLAVLRIGDKVFLLPVLLPSPGEPGSSACVGFELFFLWAAWLESAAEDRASSSISSIRFSSPLTSIPSASIFSEMLRFRALLIAA